MRLELRGVEVGDRWRQLTAYLTPRIHEHALPFQDLHYIFALSRAGQSELVNEMLSSMEAYSTIAGKRWTEVAIPAARGLVAHAQGNWETTLALGSVLSQLQAIGGSHAQRDLFEQVYLDAWVRHEQNHQALHLLEKRLAKKRYIPSNLKSYSLLA